MRVTILGVGYVGLTTCAMLAELGHEVIGFDIDEKKIENLNKGIIPIYEPQLDELIHKNVAAKRLRFSTDMNDAIRKGEIIFICVGTPPRENGEADLSYVENVARSIAEHMDSYKIIVEKSTVPVETGEKVAETIKMYHQKGVGFDVVSNPEFLREGSAVYDTFHPDRIVIGTSSEKAAAVMKKLYEPLKAPILVTDIRSAEIIKHASNSFLATKISFINAIANICELSGADVMKVAEGMGLDHRIGKQFLNAGIGYGGSCFPKDVSAFIKISEKYGYNFKMLKAVEEINEFQKLNFIKKVEDALWVVKGKRIGVLGLAFKPNTDDMRSAPSIEILNTLRHEGAVIRAYDPKAEERSKEFIQGIEYCDTSYDAAEGADALLVLTEWKEFYELDLERIKAKMRTKIIIDGRNIFDPAKVRSLGFKYIGR